MHQSFAPYHLPETIVPDTIAGIIVEPISNTAGTMTSTSF
jgi:adenosylmethionine-8-amino-7-oxononanoate aminotransferase